ncbi:MAG: DUF4350 domain-containing protein [Halobacteriota archaeon]
MKLGYLLVAVIVAGALAASAPILNTTKEDFSTFNQDWNGCSHLKEVAAGEGYSPRALFSISDIHSTSDTGVLVMLNPSSTTSVTDQDLSTLKNFVENGGSLVLANDFGDGNAVLQGLGLRSSVTFSGAVLNDNATNWVDATHPLVTDISSSSATAGVHVLYCNYATTLNVTDTRVEVLARSAPTSSAHAAGANATGSAAGPQPVAASLEYGKGRVILLSDPSLFINGMVEKGDNERLFASLMANLTGGATATPLLFDESHRTANPPLPLVYERINTDDTVKYVIVLVSIAAVVAGMNVAAFKRKPHPQVTLGDAPVDTDAAVEDIVDAHPTWRRSQVKRLLKQLQLRRRTTHGDKK